jgi:hypothetical protein
MKHYTIAIFILALTGLCFKPGEDDVKEKGSFYATVDGKMFKLQEGQVLKGILEKKAGTMDGRTPTRTVISTIFNGNSYDKPDKTPFTETVSLEMSYDDSKLGEPEKFSMALQYSSNDYKMMKEKSKVKITAITWDDDHKHFRLSADFDCWMRSWGYPNDNKKDVNLKGHLTNIKVTVPSWAAVPK